MKKKYDLVRKHLVVCCICAFCTLFWGCSDKSRDMTSEENTANTIITAANGEFKIDGNGVTVSDNNVVTINKGGIYELCGVMEDGQVLVKVNKKEEVQLILNNITISCSFGSAIYVEKAGTTTITVKNETINNLVETADYQYSDKSIEEQDAALFSSDNMVINGKGKLIVIGNYCHGIKAKDSLQIDNVDITITAKEDGINVNDEYVQNSGSLNIDAGDDGIHSTLTLTVNGGSQVINRCYEGLESEQILIREGNISIIADDDGMNATASENGSTCYISIEGGTISITAKGDGIDSNGNIKMSAGDVEIYGPTNDGNGSIDFEKDFILTGGTILAVGSSGMAMTSGSSSTQPGLMIYFDQNQTAGTQLQIVTVDNEVITTIHSLTDFKCVYFSTSSMKQGDSYTVLCNGAELCEVTMSNEKINTLISSDGTTVNGGMMGGPGEFSPGGNRPNRPTDFKPNNLPEDFEPGDTPSMDLPQR